MDDHSTLPPEWTLPDLPHPTAPSLSTAEFHEIFGGSDVENSMPLIGLQDVVPSHQSTVSKDGDMLLSSIEETLEIKLPGAGPLDSEDTASTIEIKEGVNTVAENITLEEEPSSAEDEFEKDLAILKQSTKANIEEETVPEVKQEEEVIDSSSQIEDDDDLDSSESNAIRRSKRLRVNQIENDDSSICDMKKRKMDSSEVEGVDSVEDQPSSVEQGEVKEIDSQKVNDEEDSITEATTTSDEDCDSDDPDRVWCICQQPHNDRFMICCDRCGEWYHGDCVGISIAEGKRMEKTGKEYICIKCNNNDVSVKAERERNRTMRQNRREQIRAKQLAELIDHKNGKSNISTSTGSISKKNVVKKCVGPACEKMVSSQSIYCSDECIRKHVEFSLKKLQIRGLSRGSSTPGEFVKGSGGVTVIEANTRKLVTGLTAPTEKTLIPWLKAHPTYKVHIPSDKVVIPSRKTSTTRKSVDSEETTSASGSSKPQMSNDNMRKHVRKALQQVLQARSKLLAAEEKVSEDKLTKLATDIEIKLFNLFNQEVNQKYRNKCRSLLFNLKDSKNMGLFKKILAGDISTKQLVRMTPEQLASEELAEWREKTIKKELEMITEVAKVELQMSSGSVRKMTYKGEIEIERNTGLPMVDITVNNDEVSSTTGEVIAPKEQVTQAAPDESNFEASPVFSLLNDTTSQHDSHMFDQNCSICTSKNKPTATTPTTTSEDKEDNSEDSLPDSQGDGDVIDHVITSPDSISQSYVPVSHGICNIHQPLWKGNVSMHSMTTFSAVAYHVSGRIEGLPEVFPDTFQIIGRIGHEQVWDYIDKLRTSSSKEIVILRFEKVEETEAAYVDMMDYLIQKHRYGVMQCSAYVKDMYFIPLQFNDTVPPQLLPFNGPGLPFNRRDTFLCVITRLKNVMTPDTPKKRKYSGHVHFSSPAATEVSTLERRGSFQQVEDGNSPRLTPPISTTSIKVSFYGDSKDFDKKQSNNSAAGSNASTPLTTERNTETLSKVTGLTHSGIKSILSTLSDEKLQELASAMSTIQTTPDTSGPPSSTVPSDNSRLSSLDERLSALQANVMRNAGMPSSNESKSESNYVNQNNTSSSSSVYYSSYDRGSEGHYSGRHSSYSGSDSGSTSFYSTDDTVRYSDEYSRRHGNTSHWRDRESSGYRRDDKSYDRYGDRAPYGGPGKERDEARYSDHQSRGMSSSYHSRSNRWSD